MKLTRRKTLALGSGTIVAAGCVSLPAFASPYGEAIAALTAGAEPREGGIILSLPDVADDGHRVFVEISAPGARSIKLLADDNPAPTVAHFCFGPFSGARKVSTRIRLARTQNVTALAEMEDGTLRIVTRHIEVVVGGCGA